MINLKLTFFLFWVLGCIGIAVNPTFAKMTRDLSDHTLEEKRQTSLAFDKEFKRVRVSQDLKVLKELPKEPPKPLLPLIAKGKITPTNYKGFYGSSTTLSGNVKSKKAKMIIVHINPDGSLEGGDGDTGDGGDENDTDPNEEDEENPYLRIKILKRKRESQLQEERSRPLKIKQKREKRSVTKR